MLGYPSYHVPRGDRSRVCVPELDQVRVMIDGNRRKLEGATCRWMDFPLASVRHWAREDTLELAREYTGRCSSRLSQAKQDEYPSLSPDALSRSPIFLSGHQPELSHPGVWFKNFLLSELADQNSGIGVNILVDHDLARRVALRVPSIAQDGQFTLESVAIDVGGQALPWEYTFAKNVSDWHNWYQSIVDRLGRIGIAQPLLSQLWPSIIDSLEQGKPIGEAFAMARHRFERSIGLRTLELPFSRLAAEKSFACFVGELLTRVETVYEVYNSVREDYRLHHRIKNHLQPLPKLAHEDNWFEAPFWVYSAHDPIRRALWVQRNGNAIQLSDRRHWHIEWQSNGRFADWYVEWTKLNALKISIRPRALTLTMFLRLAIGDLFIHGVGGGKYDQMTDRMIQSLWKMAVPQYLVATATLYLPMTSLSFDGTALTGRSEKDVLRRIRDWQFSPERLLERSNANEIVERLFREKTTLLKQIPSGEAKVAWHRKIQTLNANLRQQTSDSEASFAVLLRNARAADRARAIFSSREYSIALFPPASIVKGLKSLCNLGIHPKNPGNVT